MTVFEIENGNGETLIAFQIKINEKKEIEIIKLQDCSYADRDNDYIFNSKDELIRIQMDRVVK